MKRMISFFVFCFSILGIAICFATLAAIWFFYPQGRETTQEIHRLIDDGLVEVEDRIALTRGYFATISDMTHEFRSGLMEHLMEELVDSSDFAQRAKLIAARVHQARDGLNFAKSFLDQIRKAQRHPLRLRNASEPLQIDRLLDGINSLQKQFENVVISIDELVQKPESWNQESNIVKTTDDLIQTIQIVEAVNERLGELSNQVLDARSQAKDLLSRIQKDLWLGTLLATFVFPWMALGQFSLCRFAWSRMRRKTGSCAADRVL